MDLAPTPEQEAVRQEARRFLAAEITRERRLAWDRAAEGHDPAFWQAVARLGWFGWGLPEAYGGHGASLLELGLLIEECGRAVAPLGIFASIAGGLALAALGTPAQRKAWLPGVARGEKLVTLAVAEERASADPAAFATVLRRRGGRLRLAGEKRYDNRYLQVDFDATRYEISDGDFSLLLDFDTATRETTAPAELRDEAWERFAVIWYALLAALGQSPEPS